MVNNCKRDLVLKNLDKIKEWISQGMTMKSIAKAVHVSPTTLYKYLKESGMDVDGLDAIKKAREPLVEDLENTMLASAIGYERTVKKYAKVKRCVYENGKKAEEWEEMQEYEETIYYPPDTTAGIFLLKNWAGYMNEPRAMKLRKEELELNKKKAEAQMW